MVATYARQENKLERAKLLLRMTHDAITSTPEFDIEAMGVLLARGGAEMQPHMRALVLYDIGTLEAGLVVIFVRYEAAEVARLATLD